MIEDPGEIAQLASEFVSSLDNVPQEVHHAIKEIELKDVKVQDMLPKIAAREAQLRDLLMKKEANLSEGDKTKIERLADKIRSDYSRVDEWNSHKEVLSKDIWRSVAAHAKRLQVEIAKVSPAIIEQTERALADTLPSQAQLLSATSNITGAVLASLKTPSLAGSADAGAALAAAAVGLSNGVSSSLKRKHSGRDSISGVPNARPRLSSADRSLASPSPLPGVGASGATSASTGPGGAGSPAAGVATLPKKGLKHSGLSTVLASKALGDDDFDADLEAAAGEEKDDRVYCHCQRVSFGEMIGCDSDDCPYEWFHLSCVGLSKPLPQTWYCADCRARLEREKSEQRPSKKRKKTQQKEDSQPL